MKRIPAILSFVACTALQYFSTLSLEPHDFRKEVTERKICLLIFSTILSETFLILRRTGRDTTPNVHRSSRKVPVIVVRF